MKVDNLVVYGLENAFRFCKFSRAVDVSKCTSEYTDTIKRLGSAPVGSGHDSFLQHIMVQFVLTCTIKMWVEFERYHWASICSQSTMHKISELDYDKCMNDYVSEDVKHELNKLCNIHIDNNSADNYLALLYNTPVGLELTAGVSTNYCQLKTMYYQRKNHQLPEWRDFCKVIETLPYMNDFLKLEVKDELKEKRINGDC